MATDPLKALAVTYQSGERIVAAGEAGACMFLVQSGRVRLSRGAAPSARAVEIATLEKGDFFGERALLEGGTYGIDADALEDCEVIEIGPSTFHRLLRAHPEISVRLLRKLASRVERLEHRLSDSDSATVHPPAPAAPTVTRPRPSPRGPQASLIVEGGGPVFPLVGEEVLVGRYDPVTEIQPEIDLTDIDTKRSVSRRHARLSLRDGSWYVAEEVGALNGTFVNGTRLLPGRGAPLSAGDVVAAGMVRLIFRVD